MSGAFVSMKVDGLRELEQALVQLAELGAPRVLAKALRDPMQQVLADAKALVPVDSGALRDALDLTPVRRASAARASSAADALSEVGLRIKKMKKGQRYSKYGVRGKSIINPRYYWHLVEFGAPAKGIAAKPYLRPAMDRNTQHLLDGFKSVTRSEVDRIRARFSRTRRSRW